MDVKLYNQKGEEIGKAILPASIFDVAMDQDLVHQAAITQQANARESIAHAKDRSEVSGGGRKPWRQKGTGRARHGSIRSPIWRGGGATFGPTKERVFSKKINKKMKQKALFMALSSKVRDKEAILLDKLDLSEPKTKQMAQIIDGLGKKLKVDFNKGTLIVLSKVDQDISRASRNIPKIKVTRADSLNVLDILSYRNLLMLKSAVGVIKQTYKS